MIFQDPFASLNPRMRVGEIVAEPLAIHEPKRSAAERAARATEMLRRVGLDEAALKRYPHEFSGGQRQRIGIARALILRPKLIVADEPVSALDVSVGAQVLLLLQELQREFQLTYLFISHSLPVVAQLASHIAVMRAGKLVEEGPATQILQQPSQSYTRDLLAAVPELPTRPRGMILSLQLLRNISRSKSRQSCGGGVLNVDRPRGNSCVNTRTRARSPNLAVRPHHRHVFFAEANL